MDRKEIRDRSRFLYSDELQYALARDDLVETEKVKERATIRLKREMDGQEIYELCRGMIESVSRGVERTYIVDLASTQLAFGSAIRTGDSTLCPIERARYQDWLAFDEIREQAFIRHAAKRDREREVVHGILDRLTGSDETTLEACPDLFPTAEEEAAA